MPQVSVVVPTSTPYLRSLVEPSQGFRSHDALAIADKITEDVLAGKLTVTSAYGKTLDELNAIFEAATINFSAVTA